MKGKEEAVMCRLRGDYDRSNHRQRDADSIHWLRQLTITNEPKPCRQIWIKLDCFGNSERLSKAVAESGSPIRNVLRNRMIQGSWMPTTREVLVVDISGEDLAHPTRSVDGGVQPSHRPSPPYCTQRWYPKQLDLAKEDRYGMYLEVDYHSFKKKRVKEVTFIASDPATSKLVLFLASSALTTSCFGSTLQATSHSEQVNVSGRKSAEDHIIQSAVYCYKSDHADAVHPVMPRRPIMLSLAKASLHVRRK